MKQGIVIMMMMLTGSVMAAGISLNSGTEKNQVIELYTSEGCSSCPVADKWLTGLTAHPDLWQLLVPMAFHVDYWDRLGWKDELARNEFSQRQRSYRSEGGIGQVYTPGFVVNGQEWRGFFSHKTLPSPDRPSVGAINARVENKTVSTQFTPESDFQDALQFHVAILGFGIASQIQAGENRGKTLTHDFVVIGYEQSRAERNQDGFESRIDLPETIIDAKRKAIVVWVSKVDKQSPIQAAGNWL